MRFWRLAAAFFLVLLCQLSAGTVEDWLLAFPPPVTLQSVERYPTNAEPAMPDNFSKPPATVVYLVPASETKRQEFEPAVTHPRVVQINRRFVPEVLPVVIGTTVDFPNFAPFFHNAFSYSKTKKFDLGRYPAGKSLSVTLDKPGPARVFCEIHSDMNCIILVLENPHFTYPDGKGRFNIENVSPGNYFVKIWHKTAEWGSRLVSVPAEGASSVDFREGR